MSLMSLGTMTIIQQQQQEQQQQQQPLQCLSKHLLLSKRVCAYEYDLIPASTCL